jgi:hypothetical protein
MGRISGRQLAAALIVALGASLVIAIYSLTLDDRSATGRDYIQYWASGQQLAHHANPYDVHAILRLEQSRGMEDNSPKVTLSPPLVLVFALPLGYMGAKAGLILWLALLLASSGVSMWVLWVLYGRPQSRWHVLLFVFPPLLSCLMAGQLGAFFLLGIVLFLWLHRRWPWLAGAALVCASVKPHLFLPCVVVLLLGSASRRDFRVVGGFLLALGATAGLLLALDAHAWSQYNEMLRSSRAMDAFLPTLGMAMRRAVDWNAPWIEFVPEAAACAWAAWYYWSRRQRWEWTREGLLVVLVSVACAPYSLFTDQVMLFPAILVGIYAAEKNLRAWVLLGLIAAACMVGVIVPIELPSPFYVWTAPAWLLWYMYATRGGAGVSRRASLASQAPKSGLGAPWIHG